MNFKTFRELTNVIVNIIVCNCDILSHLSIFLKTVRVGRYEFIIFFIYEPRHEKTGFLHMRKQRRRSASR